jgi:hypothetical protein
MMRLDLRTMTLAVPVLLAPSGCSGTGGSSAATPPDSPHRGGTVVGSSELASALDLVPDILDGYVFYADWSMVGDQDAASFAGGPVDFDDHMQRDLGIRSTDAQWELDVHQVHRPPVKVLRYDPRTDLSGLAAKLTRFGYHADGSILTGPTGRGSPEPCGRSTAHHRHRPRTASAGR